MLKPVTGGVGIIRESLYAAGIVLLLRLAAFSLLGVSFADAINYIAFVAA